MKLKQFIDSHYSKQLEILSPKSSSNEGSLSSTTSRKTFLYLLATLNAVYPDYDFGSLGPDLFCKIPSINLVKNNVVNGLLLHFGIKKQQVEEAIWSAIDQVINTKMCDIFSFVPPPELEPDSEEGNLWSFFYFLYNKNEKRIVFFTARAVSLLAPMQPEEVADCSEDEVSASQVLHQSLSYEQYTMASMEM